MNAQTLIGYGIGAVVIVLVIWLRTRGRGKPIRNKGRGMLIPVFLLLIVFGLSISSLRNIPDHPFHVPAIWEMLCAGLLGVVLGSIMLYHTGYEKREDGLVYSKPNANFKYVIIAVIAIRVILSQYFKSLDYTEFTILTMVMAYIYICVWRIGSFMKYRKVSASELTTINTIG
ncbi:cytochrome C biogenesis protein CcdC [Paenibacillus pectinilyticus]|uniref:Cytochrome C biogenesis protein CcdC n=1 Tax=Paenibacillus pectinilyticus TaxID=512399 RepID=A0A1C1A5L7_9BACL|nr:CcdC protein domain-containing protein [Paenibacillus pectinilyticus]OCT15837.1 cytochrome C biogenesis protein CcdC [Paenibacillus pectinilyticus]